MRSMQGCDKQKASKGTYKEALRKENSNIQVKQEERETNRNDASQSKPRKEE